MTGSRYFTVLVAALAVSLLMLAEVGPVEAAFPGTNGKIAFVRQTGQSTDIFTVNPDGTRLMNITKSLGALEDSPAWSRSGEKLAFGRDGDIFVMRADGSGLRRVTSGPVHDSSPSWSPGGRRIAFVRQRGEGGASTICESCIYKVRADGTRARQLTDSGRFATDPSWSPDGGKIAFQQSLRPTFDIFVMDPAGDGGRERNLTRTPGPQESQPDWSPDGEKLVFISFTEEGGAFNRVFTMNADGTNQKKLRDGVESPAWSPNGKRIAFVKPLFEGSGDIYTMKTDGTVVRKVIENASFHDAPAWQPL